MTTETQKQSGETFVATFLPDLLFAEEPAESSWLCEQTVFRVSAPFDDFIGISNWRERVIGPLRMSLVGAVWKTEMILRNSEAGNGVQTAAWGHLTGVFNSSWCGLKATNEPVAVRIGVVAEIVGSVVNRCTVMIDLVDLAVQALQPFTARALGQSVIWPSPRLEQAGDNEPSTLAVVREMQLALHDSAKTRDEMLAADHLRYWAEDFVWAGPGGIGVTHGRTEFVDFHQLPFRRAFPDRKGGGVLPSNGAGESAGHFVKFADGRWAVTGGWPSLVATHLGDGWLGLAASEKKIVLRVFDFYEVVDSHIAMNWVFIDIVDFLRQIDRLPKYVHGYQQEKKGA